MPNYIDLTVKGDSHGGWFKSWFKKEWFIYSNNWFDIEVNDN